MTNPDLTLTSSRGYGQYQFPGTGLRKIIRFCIVISNSFQGIMAFSKANSLFPEPKKDNAFSKKIFILCFIRVSWVAFGLGFCLLSPSGHVFHTTWETMIKSYIQYLSQWLSGSFVHIFDHRVLWVNPKLEPLECACHQSCCWLDTPRNTAR